MFSKYFLLLAGLFLQDHGHSSHLIPLKTKMCCSPHHPQSDDSPDLVHSKNLWQHFVRASVFRCELALRVPDGSQFSVFMCVPVSHLAESSGFSLCLLSYFMVLEEPPQHSPVS